MSEGVADWDSAKALANFDGDVDLMKSIVEMMVELMSQEFPQAQEKALAGDFTGMRHLTHGHLPSLKLVAMDQPARLFEAFESSVALGEALTCERLSREVLGSWQQVVHTLSLHRF